MAEIGMPPPDRVGTGLKDLPVSGVVAGDILRAIARMSPLPMVLCDPKQHDCPTIFCNAAFTRLTGYTEAEVLGRNMRLLQGPQTSVEALDTLRASVAAQQESQVDLWNYRRDGTKFWCSMFVGPVFDARGRLICWFGSQLDTSARRELDLARAHAQRIETLGAMAAGVSHEFNNLMTVVLANAESIGAEELSPRQTERLQRVTWAARTAGGLTQQMLAYSGHQKLDGELTDLNAVVRDAVEMLAQLARPDTPVELALAAGPLPAHVDQAQLKMALINLVHNASDASPAGSPIVIRTAEPFSEEVASVEVAIVDRGRGMTPDIAARAKEPFFTTKSPGRGTGLGLSMVSGFVEQSGGRMLVETEQGQGTTVRLVFPRPQ